MERGCHRGRGEVEDKRDSGAAAGHEQNKEVIKGWEENDHTYVKINEKPRVHTLKAQHLLELRDETNTSPPGSSAAGRAARATSESRRAARRPARPAPLPDSPSAKPRARARRIPPPPRPQPMKSGVVIRHRPVAGHVITSPRPLT